MRDTPLRITRASTVAKQEVENRKQAIEKVKRLKPDLVLLDINMPVMSGVQAAYEISC
jgi:CheY-like chemotaxis protein